jgi:hypothetical protein
MVACLDVTPCTSAALSFRFSQELLAGIEPATPPLGRECSNPLSYRSFACLTIVRFFNPKARKTPPWRGCGTARLQITHPPDDCSVRIQLVPTPIDVAEQDVVYPDVRHRTGWIIDVEAQ